MEKVLKSIFLVGFWIFLLWSDGYSFAQETRINFDKITTADGLSQSQVLCILQDKDGFLWFGTYGGLNRYDGYNFKIFKHDKNNPNSLINDHVKSICQDTTGKLVIGTMGGLCTYSPETDIFCRFQHEPDDTNSLSNNMIFKTYTDLSGNIWIGTWGGGLDEMKAIKKNVNGKIENSYSFIHHKSGPDSNSIVGNKIADITESPDSILWIATNYGLSSYGSRTNKFINYQYDPIDPTNLVNNISSVCLDMKGNIWASTWGYGLMLLLPGSDKFIRFTNNPNDINSLAYNTIMNLYCDFSGNVWVGTWGGGLDKILWPKELHQQSKKSEIEKTIKFVHYKNDKSNPTSISGNLIYSLLEDNTGSIWVGTEFNNLNKFLKEPNLFRHINSIPGEPNSLVGSVVKSMVMDDNNILWIATQDGVNAYNKNTGKYKLYQNNPADPNSLSFNQATHIICDKNGFIWIGTQQGLNKLDPGNNHFTRYYDDPKQPTLTHILYIYEDKMGNIWVGTFGFGLKRLDPVTKTFKTYMNEPGNPASISENIVNSIIEDSHGKYWIATGHSGLCEFDPVTEKFKVYRNNPEDSNSINGNTIYTLYIDHSNNLWIGTTGGLSKLIRNNSAENSFINYAEYYNQLSKPINGIIEDNDKKLWLTSSDGLTRFDPVQGTLSDYNISDGLQDKEFSANAICLDTATGDIYAGGINGFNIFHPGRLEGKSIPPVTRIVNLKIFNKDVNINEKVNNRVILDKSITSIHKLKLSYREYVIGFEYAALHYQSPKDNQYAFMLEGFDKDWNYVGNQRIATYTNLPPGKYTFKVKAANGKGTWNDVPTILDLVITPAWYNTIFFKIIVLLCILAVAFSFYRIRIKTLNKRQRVLKKMVSERTKELSQANTLLERNKEELSETNALLEEKQEEITLQNEELLNHRNNLEKLVDERTAELQEAKIKAEESDKLKSSFLTNMSHEIRTPMNAIIGFASLLNDETLDTDERREFIKTIENNGKTLLTIINDILDISMIEANQLVLFQKLFCVDEILAELESYYKINNEKDLDIKLMQGKSNQKTYMYNDPVRFRQIMTNLLNNAYKYTNQGFIKFGYEIKKKEINFFVEDSGIGISAENKPRVFNYFYKIESDKNKLYQGIGIGLSICKKLIKKMGGDITFKSEINKGSVFSFTLPYNLDDKDNLSQTSENIDIVNLNDIKILVAEDEPDNFRLMEKLLKRTGVTVIWAHNGKEAVEYIINNPSQKISLVLMDIKMPVMDGYKACEKIKKVNSKIPVIAVTAYAQAKDKNNILKRGFDNYISKPYSFEQLQELLSHCQTES